MEYMPAAWLTPVRGARTQPVRKNSSFTTKHFESPHFADGFTLDMKKQEDLGLIPPQWSVNAVGGRAALLQVAQLAWHGTTTLRSTAAAHKARW